MNINDYQTEAYTTAKPHLDLYYFALGLNGEAGEVADQVKRIIRDDNRTLSEERRQKLLLELGDVAWYLAAMATACDFEMSEVLEGNLSKLRARQATNTISGEGDVR